MSGHAKQLGEFTSITGLSEEKAKKILSKANWNLEVHESFFNEEE